MGKGNPNGNPGNKGGGRKSAYAENEIAKRLNEVYDKGLSLSEYAAIALKVEMVKTGKQENGEPMTAAQKKQRLSLFEVTVHRAMSSDSILNSTLKKLVGDKLDADITGEGLLGIFKAISEDKQRQRPPEEPPEEKNDAGHPEGCKCNGAGNPECIG